VLTGGDYPRTLLAAVVQRIRADGEINARRAAICAAFIRRNLNEELAMSLDRNNPDPAYRLGRLFAVLEGIQKAALPGLSATIRDRYFGAASATPARVFPLLVKNATHHLSLLRKGDGGGLGHWFDAEMGEIWSALPSEMPRTLPLEDQARFIAGYYHQRWAKKTAETAEATTTESEESHQ
jgi:CRISPR-associated protein Csd1